MSTTARIGITLIEEAQSQKATTVNEGFQRIDDAMEPVKTFSRSVADGEVLVLPYSYDGTSRSFDLKAIRLRCETAPSSTLTITAEKYAGSVAFSGTSVLSSSFTIASGAFEGSRTTGFTGSTGLTSGTKIKVGLSASGQAGSRIGLEFEEIV
jgi:hypothetical protein